MNCLVLDEADSFDLLLRWDSVRILAVAAAARVPTPPGTQELM